MPFATQFALSLEATSLVPLALTAANNVAGAFMNLARDLQNSGSDIVVEEDLANVFGRSHIAPQFASSFKTIILEHREATPLVEGIFLQSGPGPTVTRALKHPPYFSMVVQLSLLSWVHEKVSLAGAIKQILEKRLEGAPAGSGVQVAPSQDGLVGVIRACQEQTALYEWNKPLWAVASLLGMDRHESLNPLSSAVLAGLLDMFAIVQSLPEDRLIFVSCEHGTCVLCVWAHHVLGLTVLVRLKDTQEIRLGIGNEHLIVDCREAEGCSISLLDCDGGDVLISIKQDEEDLDIDATSKMPVHGYGRALLRKEVPDEDVVEEIILLITTFALDVSKHCVKKGERDTDLQIVRRTIDERRILEAARLLFDKPSLTRQAVNPYIEEYRKRKSVGRELESPPFLKDWISTGFFAERHRSYFSQIVDRVWRSLVGGCIYCLVISILAFAHVQDLTVCAKLPLYSPYILCSHPLYTDIERWDGQSTLGVFADSWFSAITALMFSGEAGQVPSNTCLTSNHGWSLFISTFSPADPFFIDRGQIAVVRGVPCRHGIRKTGIVDGPRKMYFTKTIIPLEKAGDLATLRCHEKVGQKRIQCGEQNNVFVLSIRLTNLEPTTLDALKPVYARATVEGAMVRTGYSEYHQALWLAQLSRRCEHSPQESQNVRLPPGSVTVSALDVDDLAGIKIKILLTARNQFARWRALVWTLRRQRQVLLRGNDCCFACVVDQAASQPGQWSIIL